MGKAVAQGNFFCGGINLFSQTKGLRLHIPCGYRLGFPLHPSQDLQLVGMIQVDGIRFRVIQPGCFLSLWLLRFLFRLRLLRLGHFRLGFLLGTNQNILLLIAVFRMCMLLLRASAGQNFLVAFFRVAMFFPFEKKLRCFF